MQVATSDCDFMSSNSVFWLTTIGGYTLDEKALVAENLWGIDPGTPIYRVAKVGFLVRDIQNSVLTLPRVIGWEDTHEAAFFTRSVPLSARENVGLSRLAIDWFGQCWSTQPESDAMWRIYNQQGDSVRIETTAGDLLRTAFTSAIAARPAYTEWARLGLFLGKVSYHSADKFKELMLTPVQDVLASNAKPMAKMLMQKRDPFNHEREVRFLYQSHSGSGYADAGLDDSLMCLPQLRDYKIDGATEKMTELIQLPFDWQVVTGAMIGPRVDPSAALSIEAQLKTTAPWMTLSRSELYGLPAYAGQF